MVSLLLAQVCCVALAVISAYGAWKTIREGFYITDTRKVQGAAPKILGAGIWLVVAAGLLAIAFVALPMRGP